MTASVTIMERPNPLGLKEADHRLPLEPSIAAKHPVISVPADQQRFSTANEDDIRPVDAEDLPLQYPSGLDSHFPNDLRRKSGENPRNSYGPQKPNSLRGATSKVQRLPFTQKVIFYTDEGLTTAESCAFEETSPLLESQIREVLDKGSKEPPMLSIELFRTGKKEKKLRATWVILCSCASHKKQIKNIIRSLDLQANQNYLMKVLVAPVDWLMDVDTDENQETAMGLSWVVQGQISERTKSTQPWSLCGTAIRFVAGLFQSGEGFLRGETTAGGIIMVGNQPRLLTVSHPIERLEGKTLEANLQDDIDEMDGDDSSSSGWDSDSSDSSSDLGVPLFSSTHQLREEQSREDTVEQGAAASISVIKEGKESLKKTDHGPGSTSASGQKGVRFIRVDGKGHLAYPVEGASSKAFASRDLLRPLPKIFARIGAISATSSVDVSFQDTGTAQQESDGHMDWALIKLKQELLCPNAVDIPQQGSVAIVDVASNMEPWVNKRTVSIVTGMSGVVEGSLSTSPARLLLGSKTFLVYCITLSNPLIRGDSGAWVISEKTLLGHVIAGRSSRSPAPAPCAYMLPIASIFKSISSQHGGAQIRLPSSAEILDLAVRSSLPRQDPSWPVDNQLDFALDPLTGFNRSRRSSISTFGLQSADAFSALSLSTNITEPVSCAPEVRAGEARNVQSHIDGPIPPAQSERQTKTLSSAAPRNLRQMSSQTSISSPQAQQMPYSIPSVQDTWQPSFSNPSAQQVPYSIPSIQGPWQPSVPPLSTQQMSYSIPLTQDSWQPSDSSLQVQQMPYSIPSVQDPWQPSLSNPSAQQMSYPSRSAQDPKQVNFPYSSAYPISNYSPSVHDPWQQSFSSSSAQGMPPHLDPFAQSPWQTNFQSSFSEHPSAQSQGSTSSQHPPLSTQLATSNHAPLFPSFRMLNMRFRRHPSVDFRVGTVFVMMHAEPANASPRPVVWQGRVRMVVVRQFSHHCLCIPIHAYQGRGTLKPSVDRLTHAVVHMVNTECTTLPGEHLVKKPISVIPDRPEIRLHPTSRLNFASIHSVRYDQPINIIGRISEESMPWLLKYWHDTMLSPKDNEG